LDGLRPPLEKRIKEIPYGGMPVQVGLTCAWLARQSA